MKEMSNIIEIRVRSTEKYELLAETGGADIPGVVRRKNTYLWVSEEPNIGPFLSFQTRLPSPYPPVALYRHEKFNSNKSEKNN